MFVSTKERVEYKMIVNKNIFRTYDIRGIVPDELDTKTANLVGKAFATQMKNAGKTKIIVGHDNRITSDELSNALIDGIISTGMNVVSIGTCVTPMTYFAREYLKIKPSIMVTASHNPKEYNGFKICGLGTDTIFGDEIQALREFIEKGEFAVSENKGEVEEKSLKEEYISDIVNKVKLGDRKLKVAIDCGSGAGSYFAEELFKRLGVEVLPVCCEPDGNFPIHHPDPSQEKNMLEFEKFIVENKCDIGLAFDGDADRVIAFDENGKIYYGDEYAVIIWRDLMPKHPNSEAILDVKCSQSLYEEIERLGGKPRFCKVGSSLIKAEIRKNNILFTSEYAGHVYFNDEYYGYDDAMYAGARLLKILSGTDKNMSELSAGAMKYHGTPEIIRKVTDESKFEVVEMVKKKYLERGLKVIDIDGARVIFKDGWGLIRASNTGPNLTIKAEATTDARCKEMIDEIEEYVKECFEKVTNKNSESNDESFVEKLKEKFDSFFNKKK